MVGFFAGTWIPNAARICCIAWSIQYRISRSFLRKRRVKHGGGRHRVPLNDAVAAPPASADDLLALDEALTRLATEDPEAAQVVQLRYFAGLSVEEAAESLGMSRATAYRHWTFARAWLLQELADDEL